MSEQIEEIAAVLADTGPAHHTAFAESDGYDPEWPLWYAKHVADDVRRILERPDLTVSRLVWALVDADQAHDAEASEVPWSRFYAERFVAEL